MVPNPHDALFQVTFSQPEHAAGELRHVLPATLVARIDWSSLQLRSGRFVDEALSGQETDLLFSASMMGQEVFLYLLFEHQSTAPPLMPLRMLRYEVRIWSKFVDENPGAKKIPVILPIVLHHSENGWTAAHAFDDVLDAGVDMLAIVAPYVPRFRFLLDDISAASDQALHDRTMSALGRLALFCFRHAREPEELIEQLAGWLDLVGEVRRAPNGAAALAAIFRYILLRNEKRPPEDVVKRLLLLVGREGRDEVVTAGEQLIERGRLKGLQEGLQEGLQTARNMLLKLLRTRFGALPDDAVARVQAADSAQLDLWAERVLTAATLAEVLA